MRSDLVIVVVTHNSAAAVVPLLDSLPAACSGLATQTIVVDNGSNDDTLEVVERRSDCVLVSEQNVGYAAGINRGVAEAGDSEAILALNADVILRPGCAVNLLAAMRRTGAGIVAPRLESADGELQPSLRRRPSVLRALGLTRTGWPMFSEYVSDPADYADPREVDWATGAALLVSRDCHVALKGWDESYFLFSEETDLSLRARDRGFRTYYEPSAVAIHAGGGSGRTAKTHTMRIVNKVRLVRRRHGTATAWAYFAAMVARESLRAMGGSSISRVVVGALVSPRRRPPELGCSERLMPR